MKITYYTAGDRNFASSRLRAFKVADVLIKMGHEIMFNPQSADVSADVIVVQKRFDLVNAMERWRKHGVRVIFDIDDWIPTTAVLFADQVTVDTHAKLELFPGSIVIPDALDIEADTPRKEVHQRQLKSVVWFGNIENFHHLENVIHACHLTGVALRVITGRDAWEAVDQLRTMIGGLYYKLCGKDWTIVSWNPDTIDREIKGGDLVVCPFTFGHNRSGQWSDVAVRSKSANRVLKAWGLGMPAAGTPIPSYVDAGLEYCAETVDEWIDVLERLQDRGLREQDAMRGYEIAQRYTAQNVAQLWLEVMRARFPV